MACTISHDLINSVPTKLDAQDASLPHSRFRFSRSYTTYSIYEADESEDSFGQGDAVVTDD